MVFIMCVMYIIIPIMTPPVVSVKLWTPYIVWKESLGSTVNNNYGSFICSSAVGHWPSSWSLLMLNVCSDNMLSCLFRSSRSTEKASTSATVPSKSYPTASSCGTAHVRPTTLASCLRVCVSPRPRLLWYVVALFCVTPLRCT